MLAADDAPMVVGERADSNELARGKAPTECCLLCCSSRKGAAVTTGALSVRVCAVEAEGNGGAG